MDGGGRSPAGGAEGGELSRTSWTPKKERVFLDLLRAGHTVKHAGDCATLPHSTLYDRRHRDTEFAARWDAAEAEGSDILEQEAFRRAVEGTSKPIYQGGELVGTVREYSDTLLIFLLKGRKPEKFRERVDNQHSGNVVVKVVYADSDD